MLLLKDINKNIISKNYSQALKLCKQAKETYKDSQVLCSIIDFNTNYIKSQCAQINQQHSDNQKVKGKVVFYGINVSKGFSGGRYHAWLMAVAAAEMGWEVHFITNEKPSFYDYFSKSIHYPSHLKIKMHLFPITNKICEFPSLDADVLFFVPHNRCLGRFTDNAFNLIKKTGSKAVLINFESPNWFNSLSPASRDESLWDGWKAVSEHSSMVLSISKEGEKYAKLFYNKVPTNSSFDFLWPTINTREADSVPDCPKEKRILFFVRFTWSEHKGVDLLPQLFCEAMSGYTLVFIVGGQADEKALKVINDYSIKYNFKTEFLSVISEREKWSQLKRASLIIYPSFFEGFGLPPVEAQYANTPCVAFDLPVLREVSGDGIIYVPPGDTRALRNKVTEVLKTPKDWSCLKPNIMLNIHYDKFRNKLDQILAKLKLKSKDDMSNKLTKPLKCIGGISKCEYRHELNRIRLSGWLLPVEKQHKVSIYVNNNYISSPTLGIPRPDIYKKNPEYNSLNSGWKLDFILDDNIKSPIEVTLVVLDKGTEVFRLKRSFDIPLRAVPTNIGYNDNFEFYWSSLKDSLKGKRGFIIGNGPSLKIDDLNKLQNEITIASNKIFLAFPQTDWRPTYYTVADALVIEKSKDICQKYCDPIHAPRQSIRRWNKNHNLRLWEDLGAVSSDPVKNNCVSGDLSKGAYAGYTITFFNVQMAIHLGLNPIYLIGCDHYYAGENNVKPDDLVEAQNDNHFVKNYREKGEIVNAAPIEQMTLGYRHLKQYCDNNNIEIYNSTRGGHLEVFKRADFDNVISEIKPKQPKVSICIPVLNGMPFISDCLESIKQQTLKDFEVVIGDGFSNDGTYEILKAFALENQNVTLKQFEPNGIYDGLNKCIELSKGEYIYILMADDLMHPNCLELMVDALDKNLDCSLCQTGLSIINEQGEPITIPAKQWKHRPISRLLGNLINVKHKRIAPHDAIIMFSLGTVYTSLTQLLIRKDVFDDVGLFSQGYRSYGDLEWQMRAASKHSCIFLPDKLAIWRRHDKQASLSDAHTKARKEGVFADIGNEHFSRISKLDPSLGKTIKDIGLSQVYELDKQSFKQATPNRSYENVDILIDNLSKLQLKNYCSIIKDSDPVEQEIVTKKVDPYNVYGKLTSERLQKKGILDEAALAMKTKKENTVVYYPPFETETDFNNHYHRASWYLPGEKNVLDSVGMSTSSKFKVNTRPDYFCESKESVKIKIYDNNEDYIKSLASSKMILVWDNISDVEKLKLNVLKTAIFYVNTNDASIAEYGTYCKVHWWMSDNFRNVLLENSSNKFKSIAKELKEKNYDSSVVFCTGPSIDSVYEYDFSKSIRIVCNTIVSNPEMMDYIDPHFITAGDVVSHWGISKYAEKFREALRHELLKRDCYLLTTAQFGNLFRIQYPEIADKILLCHASSHDPIFDFAKQWALPFLASTLNIHMFPLASTFSDNIFILGADGKNPNPDKNEDFWAHSEKAHFHDLVDTGHKAHPTFDKNRQKTTIDRYIESVRNTIETGENQYKKKFYSISRSFTPVIKDRYISKEKLNLLSFGPKTV